MANTKDLVVDPKLKVLLWSPSGTGKTSLVGTASQLGPTYIYDFDFRLEALAGLDIEFDKYRDSSQLQPKAFDAAQSHLDKLLKLDPFPYKVVALDGLTTFAIAAMNRGMIATKAFMPQLTRINTNGVNVPAQPDYMTAMALTEQFISKLVSLPCHVIVTAHEDNDKDEITQRIFKNIAVSGKLAIRLPGYFNELWRMQITTTAVDGKTVNKYSVVTRPDNLYSARTCYREALEPLEEADFAKIYAKICKYLAAKSAATGGGSAPVVPQPGMSAGASASAKAVQSNAQRLLGGK